MPIIKSAQKKLRKDKKRTQHNAGVKKAFKKALKAVTGQSSKKGKDSKKKLSEAFSKIDKAAKMRTIHRNKAARLKSRVSRLSRGT